MTPPTATGNINYSDSESQLIIEEAYTLLKDNSDIVSIIKNGHNPNATTEDENIQEIEKQIDIYILANTDLQQEIVNIYERRDVTIPFYKSTEKNEIIDAKKKIIRELAR